MMNWRQILDISNKQQNTRDEKNMLVDDPLIK